MDGAAAKDPRATCSRLAYCVRAVLCAQTAIAAAKYFRQFADYKKKVARGYKWDGKGNAIAPAGEQDVMDVERTAGSMEETSNPVAEGADEYEMET